MQSPSHSKPTRRWVLAGGLASLSVPALANDGLSHHAIADVARSLDVGADRSLRILLPQGSLANLAPVAAEFRRLTGVVIHTTEVPVDDVDVQLALDKLSGTQTPHWMKSRVTTRWFSPSRNPCLRLAIHLTGPITGFRPTVTPMSCSTTRIF